MPKAKNDLRRNVYIKSDGFKVFIDEAGFIVMMTVIQNDFFVLSVGPWLSQAERRTLNP